MLSFLLILLFSNAQKFAYYVQYYAQNYSNYATVYMQFYSFYGEICIVIGSRVFWFNFTYYVNVQCSYFDIILLDSILYAYE